MDGDERHQDQPDPGVDREQRPAHEPRDIEPHDLAEGDPQVPGGERRSRADRDQQSEPEAPPAPPGDRTRHAPADLEHEGDDEQPGQDAMGDEQPRAARVAGAQRNQSRRGKQHDEHREEPVEGRAGHRRSGLSSHGEAQSRATTPRTGSPVDCLPEPPIGTHTSFLLGWFGS